MHLLNWNFSEAKERGYTELKFSGWTLFIYLDHDQWGGQIIDDLNKSEDGGIYLSSTWQTTPESMALSIEFEWLEVSMSFREYAEKKKHELTRFLTWANSYSPLAFELLLLRAKETESSFQFEMEQVKLWNELATKQGGGS